MMDRDWNTAEKRERRIATLTRLLNGEMSSQYIVPQIKRIWPKLETELLGRELGWDINYQLIGKLILFKEGDDFWLPGEPYPSYTQYAIGCQFRDSKKQVGINEESKAEVGDADFVITADGTLESFIIRKNPSYEVEHPVFGKGYETCFKDRIDDVDFMNPDNPIAMINTAADLADLMLTLLSTRGQLRSKSQSPDR